MSDAGKLRGWLFECKNCGRPITSYYDMWKHDHKLDDPFAWACSDDAGERYGGPQAEPTDLESDAIAIRREADGSWDITNEAFAVALEAGVRAGAVSLMGLEAALLAYFDALAASSGAIE